MSTAGPMSVHDLSVALQRFSLPDYIVFVVMLVSSLLIGVYFGFQDHRKHKKTKNNIRRGSEALDYLVGGRNMKIFPVAMSLVASYISGISLLGTSTEIYVYGTQYCYIITAIIAMAISSYTIYLPIFHDLQLTSTYEYLQIRFDKKVRLFSSVLFVIGTLLWLPIVIYVPALAFNQVTGIEIHLITPIVCLVCIFYTCIGGLKAVVWADVLQTIVMTGALLLVMIKGTNDVGGLSVVFQRNYDSGRIEKPDFSIDPTMRHTFWTLFLGGSIFWINTNAINQNMIQRYLSLPTLKAARKALILYVIGLVILLSFCCYNGLLIYATYYDCDPLTTKLAKAKDQLVPLLVMDILGEFSGLPGLFVAGVFSAALSSLSTGLNSLAAIVLEDFYKPYAKKQLTEKQTAYLMRSTVVIFGAIAVALVFVVEKLGAVLQLSMTLGSVTFGPAFGVFIMGMFMPFINAKSALAGGIGGLIGMSWICIKAQTAIALGRTQFLAKPVSTDGCEYSFDRSNIVNATLEDFVENRETTFYDMSYLYYTLVGTIITCAVGCIACCFYGFNDLRNIDPLVLAPFLRKYIKSRVPSESEVNEKNTKSVTHTFDDTNNQLIN